MWIYWFWYLFVQRLFIYSRWERALFILLFFFLLMNWVSVVSSFIHENRIYLPILACIVCLHVFDLQCRRHGVVVEVGLWSQHGFVPPVNSFLQVLPSSIETKMGKKRFFSFKCFMKQLSFKTLELKEVSLTMEKCLIVLSMKVFPSESHFTIDWSMNFSSGISKAFRSQLDSLGWARSLFPIELFFAGEILLPIWDFLLRCIFLHSFSCPVKLTLSQTIRFKRNC